MINPNNGSSWGLKKSGEDITPTIFSILDNAKRFIIVCGYNFDAKGYATAITPRLVSRRKQSIKVLLITPPRMWGFGNRVHTQTIRYLSRNMVGVVLNYNNHSKWMLTDQGYYYGSSNFTGASMKKKIE